MCIRDSIRSLRVFKECSWPGQALSTFQSKWCARKVGRIRRSGVAVSFQATLRVSDSNASPCGDLAKRTSCSDAALARGNEKNPRASSSKAFCSLEAPCATCFGATGRNRTCDVAFGGPHDIHFTTVARGQPRILAPRDLPACAQCGSPVYCARFCQPDT